VTITPAGTTVSFSTVGSESQMTLSNPVLFANISPHQRVYIADTPVTYICDYSEGQKRLTRYWNYTIAPIQPTDPSASPLSGAQSAPLAKNINHCDFAYKMGTDSRNGVVNIALSFTKNAETSTVMEQIEVNNPL
jgi:hypothetical protein